MVRAGHHNKCVIWDALQKYFELLNFHFALFRLRALVVLTRIAVSMPGIATKFGQCSSLLSRFNSSRMSIKTASMASSDGAVPSWFVFICQLVSFLRASVSLIYIVPFSTRTLLRLCAALCHIPFRHAANQFPHNFLEKLSGPLPGFCSPYR